MLAACLSAASILRCESFTRIQNQLLIIPTALELVFTTTLIFTNWYSDKRFLLITAEGWLYFSLALLELLSHILPAVRDSLHIFQSVDISLAATSFLPLFLYTLFVFLYTRAELIDTLPSRFQAVATLLIAMFIPAIMALNEVASFIGISRRIIDYNGRPTVAIGFKSAGDQHLWTFFTSLTLALLTAFQAINFCFAFFRVTKVFLAQRDFEVTSNDRAHLFRGTAWVAGGLKLGAIETVIGFAQGSFGSAITRRIFHFLSRAFLCIGIVKGVDTVLDFAQVSDEMTSRKQFRRSQLKNMVSNPRSSTFRQLSPTAAAFHSYPRAGDAAPRTDGGLPGMTQFAHMRDEPRQRVTIHFTDGAPTLHMRFSALDLPSPTTIVESVKSRPPSEWGAPSRRASSYYPNSVMTRDNDIPDLPSRTPIYQRHTRAISDFSLQSYPDSINAVRELAAQFPGLPPRVTEKTPNSILPWEDPYPPNVTLTRANSSVSHASTDARTLSTSNSLSRRKPVPRISDNIDPFEDAEVEVIVEEVQLSHDVHASLPLSVGDHRISEHVHHNSVNEAGYKIGLSPTTSFSDSPITSASGYTQTVQSVLTTPATDEPFQYDNMASALHSGKSQDFTDSVAIPSDLPSPMSRLRQMPTSRIKSLGKAPRRYTPTPVKTGLVRGSIYIEPITIPPKQTGMPVAVQDVSGSANYRGQALRDSEVLGAEEHDLFVRGTR